MQNIVSFRDLEVWQLAMELVECSYRMSEQFPRAELFGLTGQLRRAAISIPANVAEGHSRRSTKAFLNHVSIAIGSHGELITCLEIARRLGFISQSQMTDVTSRTDSVGRLLHGLHRALTSKLKANRALN